MIITFNEWLSKKRPSPSFEDSLKDYFKDQEEEREEEDKKNNWLYNYHVDVDEYDDDISYIHSNYERAMNRRRPGTALDFDSFYNYISKEDVLNFRFGNSIVFGGYKNGIFFPSHFSPSSLKEGLKLFEELAKHRVVLFVPEDLSVMAEKVGFFKIASNIPVDFRGNEIFKNVLVSNKQIIPELKKMMEYFDLPNFKI
jgi:hypothetical protein